VVKRSSWAKAAFQPWRNQPLSEAASGEAFRGDAGMEAQTQSRHRKEQPTERRRPALWQAESAGGCAGRARAGLEEIGIFHDVDAFWAGARWVVHFGAFPLDNFTDNLTGRQPEGFQSEVSLCLAHGFPVNGFFAMVSSHGGSPSPKTSNLPSGGVMLIFAEVQARWTMKTAQACSAIGSGLSQTVE